MWRNPICTPVFSHIGSSHLHPPNLTYILFPTSVPLFPQSGESGKMQVGTLCELKQNIGQSGRTQAGGPYVESHDIQVGGKVDGIEVQMGFLPHRVHSCGRKGLPLASSHFDLYSVFFQLYPCSSKSTSSHLSQRM